MNGWSYLYKFDVFEYAFDNSYFGYLHTIDQGLDLTTTSYEDAYLVIVKIISAEFQ